MTLCKVIVFCYLTRTQVIQSETVRLVYMSASVSVALWLRSFLCSHRNMIGYWWCWLLSSADVLNKTAVQWLPVTTRTAPRGAAACTVNGNASIRNAMHPTKFGMLRVGDPQRGRIWLIPFPWYGMWNCECGEWWSLWVPLVVRLVLGLVASTINKSFCYCLLLTEIFLPVSGRTGPVMLDISVSFLVCLLSVIIC